jgi:L-ascorbate metabolism protein UlaG (beta-lactamase superfamily)
MTTGMVHDYGVLQVSYIPAAHYTREHDPIRGERWVSMLLDWGSVALFHGGDTIVYDGYIEAIQALPRADVGMLACNGSDAMRNARDIAGNMIPADVRVLSAKDLFVSQGALTGESLPVEKHGLLPAHRPPVG